MTDQSRFTHKTYRLGWRVREDGDIETNWAGTVALEEFAASHHIDGVQLAMAREIKRKHLAQQATDDE